MPTIDFLPIANGVGASVESQAQYVTDLGIGGTLEHGYQNGIADILQVNKTWRQSSMMSAAVAHFISNTLAVDVLDDGDLAALTALMSAAVLAVANSVVAANPTSVVKNYVINGSFSQAQRVTMPTVNNSYSLDRWRLLVAAANAAVISQDTADVPTGAKYACKLVVGATNNQKFGIFQPIEGVVMRDLQGQVCSLLVPLKATAGLTNGAGKIRIGILQWTGVEDATTADPVAVWNGEGVNPTLAAGWAFANVPAALAVGLAWGDFTVTNIAIAANAVNLGILIWNDDMVTSTAVDILRIGGYVRLILGAAAPSVQTENITEERINCQRYYEKSYDDATAPASVTIVGAIFPGVNASLATDWTATVPFKVNKRITGPTMSYWDRAGNPNVFSVRGSGINADNAGNINPVNAGIKGAVVDFGATNTGYLFFHFVASCEI